MLLRRIIRICIKLVRYIRRNVPHSSRNTRLLRKKPKHGFPINRILRLFNLPAWQQRRRNRTLETGECNLRIASQNGRHQSCRPSGCLASLSRDGQLISRQLKTRVFHFQRNWRYLLFGLSELISSTGQFQQTNQNPQNGRDDCNLLPLGVLV